MNTDAELADVERHHPGEYVDDAARETSRRLLLHFEERDQHVLAELDAAEERLAAGTFGTCEACARAIPFPRLRALPTARLCAACEETEERAMRTRVSANLRARRM